MERQQLDKIDMAQAVSRASNPEAVVYMVQRVYGDTTVDQLSAAEGFYVQAKEKPEPKKKEKKPIKSKVDHGAIVTLYTANPPRSVKWIADDLGVSDTTVVNHLKSEGIYDPGRKEES